jgi:hypothetical protein
MVPLEGRSLCFENRFFLVEVSMRDKEKRFAYHLVPPNLRGAVLYPLNQLKLIYPDIAAAHMTKYQGRLYLLEKPIPPLDCLWNDVLMLSPVHPTAIKAAMEEVGHFRLARKWFEIDAARFRRDNTAIFLPGTHPLEERILPFEPHCLAQYTQVPEAQKQFYRQVEPGKPVLLFGGIPHILYKGSIDVTDVHVIEI